MFTDNIIILVYNIIMSQKLKPLSSLSSTRKHPSSRNMNKKKALPPIGSNTRKTASPIRPNSSSKKKPPTVPESTVIGQIIELAKENPDEPRQLRSTPKSPRRTRRQPTPSKPKKLRYIPIVPEQENNITPLTI
jgi:hypothetical protein